MLTCWFVFMGKLFVDTGVCVAGPWLVCNDGLV